MFQKALKVVTAFGLFLAAYAGYVRGFALVVERLGRLEVRADALPFQRVKSSVQTQAGDLARRMYGPDHWTSGPETQLYYSADRGFWMYFRNFEKSKDGKQIEFTPFATIIEDRDGKGLKGATSESARLDLNQPIGLIKADAPPIRVVHAKLERDVRLRDDKGTADAADDLRIGPFTSIEYDEATLQITSDSQVVLEDRDLRVTGLGLAIQLRPKAQPEPAPGAAPAGGGFDGAETITVHKDVDVTIQDAGSDGILPGPSTAAQRSKGKTPVTVHSDGAMRIDLPAPRVPVKVGPPAPAGPTLAHFATNVEVLRGVAGAPRDQLNCDNLHLTLAPGRKATSAATEDEAQALALAESEEAAADPSAGSVAPTGGGPLTDLTLRRAVADGHNVQLVSAAQGLKVRCRQLIHKKQLPEAADETYLRGDRTTKLVVEKVELGGEGPDKGKVTSYLLIRTIDATVFDSGRGNNASDIVAGGPGELETRPGLDKPVERRARWADRLTYQSLSRPARGQAPGSDRKLITLTGDPSFEDVPARATLTAKKTLVVGLKPKTPTPAELAAREAARAKAKPSEPAAAEPAEGFEIENLVALVDVHLLSPGKTLNARDRLDAVFVTKPPSPVAAADSRPAAAPEKAKTKAAAPPAEPAPASGAPADPKAAPAKPAEPDATATANRVWARVFLNGDDGPAPAAGAPKAKAKGDANSPLGNQHAEIDKVYLRGAVTFVQKPEAGKSVGTRVSGEAIDLLNQGSDAFRAIVFNVDPSPAPAPATGKAPAQAKGGPDPALADLAPLAQVETDEMTIRGKVIGLDQTTDQAWVVGRGSLATMTTQGLLNEKAVTASEGSDPEVVLTFAAPPAAQPKGKADPKAAPPKKTPMTITWESGMKFFGRSTDPQGRAVARAEFSKDVHAHTEDADITCSEIMRTYMDRLVKLARPKAEPDAQADSPESADDRERSRADVALVECVRDVVVVNRKYDPATKGLLQKQRIESDHVRYRKATGEFRVDGPGRVDMYEREGANNAMKVTAADEAPAPGDRNILRTAAIPPVPGPNPGAVVGHGAGPRDLGTVKADRARVKGVAGANANANPKAKAAAAGPKALAPLILTTVRFSQEMTGRFGSGNANAKVETRWADFFGDVDVLRGRVPSADAQLDPDSPPEGAQYLTSQVLRVVSEPSRADPNAPPRNFLRAWENAYATVDDKTIQADIITFDSKEDKFFAYGQDGRDVVIAQQEQTGQPGTEVTGEPAVYNHKTGESQLVKPSAFAWVDSKTGTRPTAAKPEKDKGPVKPRRIPFRNPRKGVERKGFQGQ